MYEIHADGKTLHNPRLINEGYGVISPKVTVSISKAGTLEFIMPPNNALYDSINKLKTKVTVSQNGEEIFRGRVLNDEKDFYYNLAYVNKKLGNQKTAQKVIDFYNSTFIK